MIFIEFYSKLVLLIVTRDIYNVKFDYFSIDDSIFVFIIDLEFLISKAHLIWFSYICILFLGLRVSKTISSYGTFGTSVPFEFINLDNK